MEHRKKAQTLANSSACTYLAKCRHLPTKVSTLTVQSVCTLVERSLQCLSKRPNVPVVRCKCLKIGVLFSWLASSLWGLPELGVWLDSSCLFMRCRAAIRLLKRGGERTVVEKLEWILC